jgi:hypothetical protein
MVTFTEEANLFHKCLGKLFYIPTETTNRFMGIFIWKCSPGEERRLGGNWNLKFRLFKETIYWNCKQQISSFVWVVLGWDSTSHTDTVLSGEGLSYESFTNGESQPLGFNFEDF